MVLASRVASFIFFIFISASCHLFFCSIVYVNYSKGAFCSLEHQSKCANLFTSKSRVEVFAILFPQTFFFLFFFLCSRGANVCLEEKENLLESGVSLEIIGKDILQSLFVLHLHVSSCDITSSRLAFVNMSFPRLSSLSFLLCLWFFLFFLFFLFSFFSQMLGHAGHGGGEAVGTLGHRAGNHRRRRLGRLVDVVDLAPLALEGDLFPESFDEFLKSGNFSSELVFDIGVAVSECVDSRFEVQLQFVEILAIRSQFLLRFQTLVLFLFQAEGEFVLFLGHEVEVLLVAVGGVEELLLLQIQVLLADGDLFVQPHSLHLQPVFELADALSLALEQILETQDVAAESRFLALQLRLDLERLGSLGGECVLDHSDFLLPAGGIGALKGLKSLQLALLRGKLQRQRLLLAFEEISGGLLLGLGLDDLRLVLVNLLLEKTRLLFRLHRSQFPLSFEGFDLSFLHFYGVCQRDFLRRRRFPM